MIPQKISIVVLGQALKTGWQSFLRCTKISLLYSLVFVVIGFFLIVAAHSIGTAPMLVPLAGGFMLIGPILLVGFFAIAEALAAGRKPDFSCIISGFYRVDRGFWAISVVCMLLFIIWITDAATLYGFMVGSIPLPLHRLFPTPSEVHHFLFWSSVMGIVIAFIIFAISAFSVPLLYEHRAGFVTAVTASVHAVLRNFVVTMIWAGLLTVLIFIGFAILPLFVVFFPVLALASFALYQAVFPKTDRELEQIR